MSLSTSQAKLRTVAFPRGTTFRSILALLLREFATNNANAFGGVAWAFVSPLASIIVATTIFSAGFRNPPIGDVFAIFYATGVVPFTMFTAINGRLGNAIKENRRILKYPRISVMDCILSRLIFVILIQTLVGLGIYTVILSFWDTKTVLDFQPIFCAMALAILLGFGVGTVNAYLFRVIPTWRHIWGIATTPLFLLSCVIYSFEQVPQPFDAWLIYNPLVHIVAMSRTGFYHGYPAHHVEPLYPLAVGLILSIMGLLLLTQGRARLLAR